MPIITATKTGVTLKLTDAEALDLAAFIGHLGSGPLQWYDEIANALESKTEERETDAYGNERHWTKTIRQLTEESGSEARANEMIHEITARQVRLFPESYR